MTGSNKVTSSSKRIAPDRLSRAEAESFAPDLFIKNQPRSHFSFTQLGQPASWMTHSTPIFNFGLNGTDKVALWTQCVTNMSYCRVKGHHSIKIRKSAPTNVQSRGSLLQIY